MIIVLVARVLGFFGIAAGAVEFPTILFVVFLLLFVVSVVVGLIRRR